MSGDGRRARILAQITDVGAPPDAGKVLAGACRFAVSNLDLSGCAVMLMSPGSTVDVLADAGRDAGAIAELQFTLGEGPCLDAHTSGVPVFATDLARQGARWPSFSAAAADLGVFAEFSLPLAVGDVGLGTLDLSRHWPGMLDREDLADALTVADIATDAVLMLHGSPAGPAVALVEPAAERRLVVHQATGMIAAQLDSTTTDALASLRAAAFTSGRPIADVAGDVVARRVSFRD